MSHTPGPWLWRWKSGSLHQAGTDGYQYGLTVLCPVYEYDSGVDTQIKEADAHLIAAAPAMYAALKRCLNYIENTEGELGIKLESGDMARAALAAAEGRGE